MKTSNILFFLAISTGIAKAKLRGGQEDRFESSFRRELKGGKDKKSGGGGGGGNKGGTKDDFTNRVVDDGKCCNGPATPQPPSGAGNRAPSNCPDLNKQLPVYSIKKGSQEYITGIPRENACECNDQCAFQDGTSMVCCLKSHYFVDTNRLPINACVDTTDLTEAVMSGCIVGSTDDSEGPILRNGAFADPLDNDLGVRR